MANPSWWASWSSWGWADGWQPGEGWWDDASWNSWQQQGGWRGQASGAGSSNPPAAGQQRGNWHGQASGAGGSNPPTAGTAVGFEPGGIVPPGFAERVLNARIRTPVSRCAPTRQGQNANRRNFANLKRRQFWRDAEQAAQDGAIFNPHEWVLANCSWESYQMARAEHTQPKVCSSGLSLLQL